MLPAPTSLVRRRRRSLGAAVGAAALAALALSGAGTGAQALSPTGSPSGADCATAGSSARVAAGHDGVDPNSVTPTQAAALEQKITAATQAQGLTARGTGASTIKIRTFVHVITATDGTGAVSRDQIRRQIAVINAGFAGRTASSAASSPFRFVVAGVDVTRNDAWYNWTLANDGSETADAMQAKRSLHRGGYADLNVYITGLGSGLLGYATFPDGPLKLDGLVILNESLPGGDAAPYNLGDTATHEIGHWLGLFHTFENGCNRPGDYVADTPYQDDGDNIFFCGDWDGDGNTTRPDDTCPQPGKDPVHNFMSYGDDFCLDRFTPGQVKREVRTWYALRAGR